MDTTVLLVVGVLAVLAVLWAVCKMIKVAAFCGIAAAVIYIGYQYILPFWEAHIAPLVASAGSLF